MAFLSKKEFSLINMINASKNVSDKAKKEAVAQVNYNARLRSDGYRKPVKIFLNVISSYKNEKVAKAFIL